MIMKRIIFFMQSSQGRRTSWSAPSKTKGPIFSNDYEKAYIPYAKSFPGRRTSWSSSSKTESLFSPGRTNESSVWWCSLFFLGETTPQNGRMSLAFPGLTICLNFFRIYQGTYLLSGSRGGLSSLGPTKEPIVSNLDKKIDLLGFGQEGLFLHTLIRRPKGISSRARRDMIVSPFFINTGVYFMTGRPRRPSCFGSTTC